MHDSRFTLGCARLVQDGHPKKIVNPVRATDFDESVDVSNRWDVVGHERLQFVLEIDNLRRVTGYSKSIINQVPFSVQAIDNEYSHTKWKAFMTSSKKIPGFAPVWLVNPKKYAIFH